jgi:prepilin-type processing-associated H-X9-DG protein/prepilin-type N-terminal cleavage/methylation domain-containing protein
MKPSRFRRSAFTLLELLVVVAILALLIGMMLPSLSRAKQHARKTVCLANIRHLALANLIYAEDNSNYLVLAAEGIADRDVTRRNLRRWHGQRSSTSVPFDPSFSPLIRYIGSAGLKQCPSFVKDIDFSDRAGPDAAFEAGCGGYGYNDSYVGGRSDLYGLDDKASKNSVRTTDIRSPSQTVLFTDSAYVTETGGSRTKIAYSFCHPPFWEFGPSGGPSGMSPNPTIDFRHLGQCNVAWADGHADSQNMDFTLSYLTHSMIDGAEAKSYGVGWFGSKTNELFDTK